MDFTQLLVGLLFVRVEKGKVNLPNASECFLASPRARLNGAHLAEFERTRGSREKSLRNHGRTRGHEGCARGETQQGRKKGKKRG